MFLRFILIVLFALLNIYSFSQEIKGIVKNKQGETIKYATIYVEELQTGTSANQDGKYAIHVSKGEFTISFRSLGYSPTVKTVSVGSEDVILNIELDIQSYILAGVTVRADDEDPAYSIMRKAIARAPGFVNQASSYTSEVYIKGSIKFEKIPKIIQKRMEVNGERPKPGETYVNESLNIISFKAPNSYEQEVISVNNSFPISDDDVPVIGLLSGSIYETQDDFYISPFAPNAFSHYNFSFEGLLQDGAWFIDKIKVTPKRKSKLLMSGYLYIVEDLWCLYSYDIEIRPLYSHLKMKQHYVPIKGNNYFPVNLFLEASISVMGVKANATYTTTMKYGSVIINPQFSQNKIAQAIIQIDTTTIVEKEEGNVKVVEINDKLDELLKNDNLSNREMVQVQKLMSKKATLLEEEQKDDPLEIISNYKTIVNKENLIRDSLYWDSIRPVPASDDEKISYRKAEEKKAEEDSASFFKKATKTVFFGNSSYHGKKTFHMHYPGLLNLKSIGFDPVDGFQVKQSFKLRWLIDSLQVFRLSGKMGYAINRESLFANGKANYQYARMNRAQLIVQGGYLTSDFNRNEGTPEFINSVYSLFMKENYIYKYHNTYINAENYYDIANGLTTKIGAEWQRADSLGNSTNFSILYPNKDYADNVPINKTIQDGDLTARDMLKLSFGLLYTPKQHYRIKKGLKYNGHSNWPTFRFNYYGGLRINEDYADFHQMEVAINQKLDFHSVSQFKYKVVAGLFLNDPTLHFSSFKHFKTMQEPFSLRSFDNAFFLINNYEYSTSDKYFQAHIKYTNDYLLLKHLPGISNTLWKENLYLNVLSVDKHYPYYELGYSLSQVFFTGEIGVFAGFKGSNFHAVGARAAFEF